MQQDESEVMRRSEAEDARHVAELTTQQEKPKTANPPRKKRHGGRNSAYVLTLASSILSRIIHVASAINTQILREVSTGAVNMFDVDVTASEMTTDQEIEDHNAAIAVARVERRSKAALLLVALLSIAANAILMRVDVFVGTAILGVLFAGLIVLHPLIAVVIVAVAGLSNSRIKSAQ